MSFDNADLSINDTLEVNGKKRRQLLPWWIKVFIWLFLILGACLPIIIFMGIAGYNAELSLYGLETNKPFSLIGIVIILLFFIKALTSFGLLKEKDWAIKLGMLDSTIGILICIYLMVYSIVVIQAKFAFRIEIFLLIPYLVKLVKIKSEWKNRKMLH